jgi:hypothetical protein
MATQEEIVRPVRYPRHVGRDGLVRPYIPHEAIGLYILNVRSNSSLFSSISSILFQRLKKGIYSKTDTYVAHIICSDSPPNWLMATSKYHSSLFQNFYRILLHF